MLKDNARSKILSILLAVMLAIGMIPLTGVSAFAAVTANSGSDLVSQINSATNKTDIYIDSDVTLNNEDTGYSLRYEKEITIYVRNGGTLTLDDASLSIGDPNRISPTASAAMVIESGGTLVLKNGGSLSLANGPLQIEDGAEVIIESDGRISGNSFYSSNTKLENSGTITVRDGGRLNADRGLYNLAGGKIYINDGGDMWFNNRKYANNGIEDEVVNKGLIETNGDSYITFNANNPASVSDRNGHEIYNEGTINLNSAGSPSSVMDVSQQNHFINKGTINVDITGSSSDEGLRVFNAMFTNEAGGKVNIGNSGGIGVYVTGESSFVNNGDITVENTGDFGMYIDPAREANSKFENAGTISVKNGPHASDSETIGIAMAGNIDNSDGTISGSGNVGFFRDYEVPNVFTGELSGTEILYEVDVYPRDIENTAIRNFSATVNGITKIVDNSTAISFFMPVGVNNITVIADGYDDYSGTVTVPATMAEYEAGGFEAIVTLTASGAPVITTQSLPDGVIGEAYSGTIATTSKATSFAVASGSLPAGLTLNTATGEISGTPTAEGTSNFSITASNSGGTSPAVSFSIKVTAVPVPVITINAQPQSATVTQDATLELSVAAAATLDAQLSYRWQVSGNGADFSNIAPTADTMGVDTTVVGVFYYRCVVNATGGAASVTSDVAKVIVNPKAPDVVDTETPSVTSDNPISLDVDGVSTAYIQVSLGASGTATPGIASSTDAEKADVTVEGDTDAITVDPNVLTSKGNIKVTAVKAGTATIKITFSGEYITDDSYNAAITVNVAGGNASEPEPEPTNPPPYNPPSRPSSNDDDDDRGSGGKGRDSDGSRGGSTTASGSSNVTTAAANSAVNSALAAARTSGAGTAIARLVNPGNITLATLQAMARQAGDTPLTVNADSIVGNAVDVRITLNPAQATVALNLSASTINATARNVNAIFDRFFANDVMTVALGQQGSFGMPVQIAAKLAPTLNTENLVFYVYNREANSFTRIAAPAHWIDANGYVHFTTTMGGSIIISDGTITRA